MSRKLFRTIVLASVTIAAAATGVVLADGWGGGLQVVVPMHPPTSRPTDADVYALTDAQRAVVAAQRELETALAESNHAEAMFKRITRQLQIELETSTQMISAREAVNTARDAYEAAKMPVLAALSERADYREACASRTRAEQVSADVRARPVSSMTERVAAGQAALDAKGVVARLENYEFAATLAVTNAKADYAAEIQRMRLARRQLDEAMRLDPRYLAAQQALISAQEWVNAAHTELAVATQNLDAAQFRYTGKQAARQDVADWAKDHGLPEPP